MDNPVTNTELTALLDRAIGPGPTGPGLDVLLHEGGRATRRRQATVAATLVTVAVVVAAGAVGATRAGRDHAGPAPMDGPTSSHPAARQAELALQRQAELELEARNAGRQAQEMRLVQLRRDGTLDLAPGVRVVERIANPLGLSKPDRSIAIAYTYKGRQRWAVMELRVDDGAQVSVTVRRVYADQGRYPSLARFARHAARHP